MSEPGTKLEIEDVLSSIRRLVSQDAPVTRLAAVPTPVEDAVDEAQCLVLTPALRVAQEADTSADAEDLPQAEAPLDMAETEQLLADAEAALAETDAVLEDAETALDEAWGLPAEEALSDEAERALGDDLAQLESTIAEMEAAIAESGVEFEPEQGHAFAADGAPPLVDLPEEFDAETFAEDAVEPPGEGEAVTLDEAEFVESDAAVIEEAELVASEAEASLAQEAEFSQEDPSDVDPDLHDEAWTTADGGMDWAEAALNLARGAEPRRLQLSDVELVETPDEAPRSSYSDLRDALETDDEAEFIEAEQNLFDEAMIDEAGLRDLVAQLIREELRGALGERITQNVRKLVRREIQRALMGQDLD